MTMNNNIMNAVERMQQIIGDLVELQNELDKLMNQDDLDSYENIPEEEMDDLIDPEYKAATRQSYINTREYMWMVIARSRLNMWISYENMKAFIDEATDRSIDFSTPDPWDFDEDEIVEEIITYYHGELMK